MWNRHADSMRLGSAVTAQGWCDSRYPTIWGRKIVADERRHVVTIDAARGLLAIAVMTYHVLSGESIVAVEKVAYYAVYAFFVISGFALYTAYRDRMETAADVRSYLIRRFFRIAPLYYLVLVARLLLYPVPRTWLLDIPANFTLLFGFANPGATSLVTGGWSLGIEIVFYILLPPILAFCGGKLGRLIGFCLALLLLQFLFINFALVGATEMTADVWSRYIQPVSFAGYFVAGCIMAEVYSRSGGTPLAWLLITATVIVFAAINTINPVDLLTGLTGLALCLATLGFVAGAAFLPQPRGAGLKIGQWLGAMSYPVYLLHPLVHYVLRHTGITSTILRVLLVYLLTFALAYVVSRFVEAPARAWGRRLSNPPPTP